MGRNIIAWAKKILCLQIALSYLLLIFSTSAGAATLKFEYDQAGNMISGQGRYYEYNDANQLIKVRKDAPSGPVIAEYVYDYQGQRVKKIENGITTYYIGKHYEERKGNTVNEKTNYIFVNGQRVAASIKKDNEPAKVSYYLNNHLGSADVVVDEQGNVTDKVRYYPYGEYRTQPNAQRHTYTGKERDEATEQYYYEARYYNPFIRRFTQADTVTPKLYDPQTLNRYSYARNNPLFYTDPTGHTVWDALDVISFGHSVYSFAKEPSWANAGWLALDTVGLLPIVPGASTIKIGVKSVDAIKKIKVIEKFDDVVDLAKEAGGVDKAIVQLNKASGEAREFLLRKFNGGSKQYFGMLSPFKGGRYVDNVVDGVAMECKEGRISASSRIREQIAKDMELIKNGYKVEWHFFKGKTGIGPTKGLQERLENAGITIIKHFDVKYAK